MKIAILLPGQPRFEPDFDSLLKNLTGYDHADWFCYITNDHQLELHLTKSKLLDFWVDIKDEIAAKEWIQSKLPPNNTVRKLEFSDWRSANLPDPFPHYPNKPFPMFYNLCGANNLRKQYQLETNVNYDLVVRVRPDIGLIDEFDLRKINVNDLQNSIIICANKVVDGIHFNDQFAVGLPDIIDVYSDMIKEAPYNPYLTTPHPFYNIEKGFATYLQSKNISWKNYQNLRITLRGE